MEVVGGLRRCVCVNVGNFVQWRGRNAHSTIAPTMYYTLKDVVYYVVRVLKEPLLVFALLSPFLDVPRLFESGKI